MHRHDLESLALAVRAQLRPQCSALDPAPLDRLVHDVALDGLTVRAVCAEFLPVHTWGLTTFEAGRAWIWLNEEAWPEVFRGTARTRFTLAHELGHVVLHGQELVDLFTRPEPEHHARLENEANRFAAHLLVPDAALEQLSCRPSEAASHALAKRFGVSLRMAARRIEEWTGR